MSDTDEALIAKVMTTTGIDRAGAEQALVDGRRLAAEIVDAVAPAKPKRKKTTSPTARSLAELRKRKWPAGVVEKFVRFPPPGHHVDLFGVLDIVAIVTMVHDAYQLAAEQPLRGAATVGIQACAGADVGRRRKKILAEPRARQWVEAGNRLELWSWALQGARGKQKRWLLRVETYAEMVVGAGSEAA